MPLRHPYQKEGLGLYLCAHCGFFRPVVAMVVGGWSSSGYCRDAVDCEEKRLAHLCDRQLAGLPPHRWLESEQEWIEGRGP